MENQSPNSSNNFMEMRERMMKGTRPVRIAATAALAFLCLFLLVAAIDGMHNWGQPDNTGPATITVTGQGTATAIPDTATISFTSTATAASVADAETAMTKINDAALSAIENEGISKDDISTTDYNVSPHYEVPVCTPGMYCPNVISNKTSGYDVSETVSVKVKDTTKVSAVLADLAKAGVQNVSGPNYVVGDTTAVMQSARKDAITKAQADAKVLAAQLGVKLGKVTDFEDNTGNGGIITPKYAATGMAQSAVLAPTVPTGSNTYTDNVSITYEIH